MDAFTALGDPVRRELLRALRPGPLRVVDLARAHPISRPAVSRHLRVLADAGLVAAADQGRERHYALVPTALAPVAALLGELGALPARRAPVVAAQALDALETEVRRTTRERRAGRRTPAAGPTATTTSHEETA